MTENQKLREVLQHAIEDLSSATGFLTRRSRDRQSKTVAALAKLQADIIALPTADHLPDAGEMVEAAAPVGEREAFELVIVEAGGSGAIRRWPNEKGESYENARVQDYRQGWLWGIEWQARAAMSAGDAAMRKEPAK